MDAETMKLLAEAKGPIQTNMILAIAFAEAIAIYALIVSIMLIFIA